MHKNKRTKNNKNPKKYSKKQPNRAKSRRGQTLKKKICKKGMTDEAYKYYKYTDFFKNSNKKSLDMDAGKDNKKTVDKTVSNDQ